MARRRRLAPSRNLAGTLRTYSAAWIANAGVQAPVDGLVPVAGYIADGRPPKEVVVMEKAAAYGAHAVFFEIGSQGESGAAQALIFLSDGPADDPEFAALHQRLWSWGGVPLVYRRTPALLQLFRCAHQADFMSDTGELICKPVKTLQIALAIETSEVWWDAGRLRNGTLWDDPAACKLLLSAGKSAHRRLVDAVERLNNDLKKSGLLTAELRRRLLILSLLVAYLEERRALPEGFFGEFKQGATRFFHVLADGPALIKLLAALEDRFNGHVFTLEKVDRDALETSSELEGFSRLVEAREDTTGQLSLWMLYSFRDLPVEVISHIYQLFVTDTDSSVYTPPSLVRLMLEEALSWSRMDRIIANDEVILDPTCGSGVFLVEAYKRLVLHWRSKNGWAKPGVSVLKSLLERVRGVDVERGAVELAAFSLCLALCDSLEPEQIRASVRLFPKLADRTLLTSCFFEARENGLLVEKVGVIVGNPPFESALKTDGAKRSYDRYIREHGSLADKQVAYLFLHEAMELLTTGGIASMLQQYNWLYNQSAASVRHAFLSRWDVREVLDFVSIRGLFQKGGADTKIVAIVAEASEAPANRKILHAVFRRGGRADAEQGFDIDYYDLHWLTRAMLLRESGHEVWRANLLGGARTLSLIKRLRSFRTLKQFIDEKGWFVREGFVEGQAGVTRPADHLIGQPLLPSTALTSAGIDRSKITIVPEKPIEGPRSPELFTPPMLLIREQMDIPHAVWTDGYLTYKNQIIGFAKADLTDLKKVDDWLSEHSTALRAFAAGISTKLFTQKATSLAAADILALPYPDEGTLDLSANEEIVSDDAVNYFFDYIRLGNDSNLARMEGYQAVPSYTEVFCSQINGVYAERSIRALEPQVWPGVICQPFAFGDGAVDWTGSDDLRDRVDDLLRKQRNSALTITRIARVYDGRFVFMLKPDRLRYWLKSTALRDSDDVLADLRTQGF